MVLIAPDHKGKPPSNHPLEAYDYNSRLICDSRSWYKKMNWDARDLLCGGRGRPPGWIGGGGQCHFPFPPSSSWRGQPRLSVTVLPCLYHWRQGAPLAVVYHHQSNVYSLHLSLCFFFFFQVENDQCRVSVHILQLRLNLVTCARTLLSLWQRTCTKYFTIKDVVHMINRWETDWLTEWMNERMEDQNTSCLPTRHQKSGTQQYQLF